MEFIWYTHKEFLTIVKEFFQAMLFYLQVNIPLLMFFLYFSVRQWHTVCENTQFPSYTGRRRSLRVVWSGKQVITVAFWIDKMWRGRAETSVIEVWDESGIEHALDERWYYLHDEKMKLAKGWGADTGRIKLHYVVSDYEASAL